MRKTLSLLLAVIISISFLSIYTTGIDIADENINAKESKSDIGINEFLPQFFSLCEKANNVEDLISASQSFAKQNNLLSQQSNNNQISGIQVFNDKTLETEATIVTSGKITDNMAIKIFYDNGDSWIKFPANFNKLLKQLNNSPTRSNTISTVSDSPVYTVDPTQAGMVLPISTLNIQTDLTCRYDCERVENGQTIMCEWCTERGELPMREGNPHSGVDISAPINTPIRAVWNGVSLVGYNSAYGNYVEMWHTNGLVTKYFHLANYPSVLGVTPKTANIGIIGNTGNSKGVHLHFEIRLQSTYDDINPMPFLQYASVNYSDYTVRTFKVINNPLNIYDNINETGTVYATLQPGTEFTIGHIQVTSSNKIMGQFTSGQYIGKWIPIGTTSNQFYALYTGVWFIYNYQIINNAEYRGVTLRPSPSSYSTNLGFIANESYIEISEIAQGDFLYGKISTDFEPYLAPGSTVSPTQAQGNWIVIECCTFLTE